jgi:Holliday junction resolvase RusA-like endonuclease
MDPATLEAFVPIQPYPKRSGTISFRGKHTIMSKHPKTAKYERDVALFLVEHFDGFKFPDRTPLRLEVAYRFTRPKSAPDRKHHIVKPDCDNLCKSFCDALEMSIIGMDQNIVELLVKKQYVETEAEVGTWFRLTNLES